MCRINYDIDRDNYGYWKPRDKEGRRKTKLPSNCSAADQAGITLYIWTDTTQFEKI